jgi:hypothetical protein
MGGSEYARYEIQARIGYEAVYSCLNLIAGRKGKLSVNDLVKKYLPNAPASLEPFTTASAQLVARFRDKPLDFQPGDSWNYSNSGYVLLSRLIENITGDSYANFVRRNIFIPLGMKDSGYDSNTAIISHRASGYASNGGSLENAGFVNMTVPQGAGGLYSATEDLLKWEQGLFGGKLLSVSSLAKMTAPFKNNYAYGLEVHTAGGRKVIEHTGRIEGFSTVLTYYPEDKRTVIVLENVVGAVPPAEISGKLAAVSHGESAEVERERKEITLDSTALSRYVGTYRTASGVNLLVSLDEDQLRFKLGNDRALAIFPEAHSVFFTKVAGPDIEFTKDDDRGRPMALVLHQNGRDTSAERMDDAELKRISLRERQRPR